MRRNNCGIECTSDLTRERRPIIIGGGYFTSRRSSSYSCSCNLALAWRKLVSREILCDYDTRVYVNATRRRANCAIDKIANAVSSHDVGSPSFWPRCAANALIIWRLVRVDENISRIFLNDVYFFTALRNY